MEPLSQSRRGVRCELRWSEELNTVCGHSLLRWWSSKAAGKGVNNSSHGAEAALGIAEGVTAGEAEATCDQRQRVGAIAATISQLLTTLSSAGVNTVADSTTNSITDGSLGGAQPSEETCQFTGLLSKPALSATGVCAGSGVSAVGQEGNNSQGHGGFEGVHDAQTWSLEGLWLIVLVEHEEVMDTEWTSNA